MAIGVPTEQMDKSWKRFLFISRGDLAHIAIPIVVVKALYCDYEISYVFAVKYSTILSVLTANYIFI